jgi:hypothetical protein
LSDSRKKLLGSALATLDLLLSVFVSKLVEGSLNQILVIDAILVAPSALVIAAILVLRKYNRALARKLKELNLKGLRWTLYLFGGLVFGSAYVVFTLLLQSGDFLIGIAVVALFFLMVMLAMDLLRDTEHIGDSTAKSTTFTPSSVDGVFIESKTYMTVFSKGEKTVPIKNAEVVEEIRNVLMQGLMLKPGQYSATLVIE